MSDRTAWRSLLLTVLLFAGQGVVAIGEMVRGAVAGRPVVALSALSLLIAIGLTARLSSARRLGLVFAVLNLALMPLVVVLSVTVGVPVRVSDLGLVQTGAELALTAPWWALQWSAALLQWRTLRNDRVRRLFVPRPVADGPRSLFPT